MLYFGFPVTVCNLELYLRKNSNDPIKHRINALYCLKISQKYTDPEIKLPLTKCQAAW